MERRAKSRALCETRWASGMCLETKLLQFADDTTAILSDLDSAQAFFILLELFEKASGLNVTKTEAMWIGSLRNCESEPLGVKWKTCIKFLGIFITYDVQLLVEINFKHFMEVKRAIDSWQGKHYKNTSTPKNDLC